MSRLTLTLRAQLAERLDMGPITPDRLAGRSSSEIAGIQLWLGNRRVPAGELFAVEGTDSEEIIIQSDSNRLDGIGAAMTRGEIRVEGRAGAYLGREMRGGIIRLSGDAGILAGTAMSGGTLRIGGRAGDLLGAALPGEHRPMRGGRIVVGGDAGDRAGDSLRRGTILIGGNSGDYCASRMTAGTVLVLGTTGIQAGLGMRRGSLLCTAAPDLPPTFNDNGMQTLAFLTLLLRGLSLEEGPFAALRGRGNRARRWLGDLGYGGKGEVLAWS